MSRLVPIHGRSGVRAHAIVDDEDFEFVGSLRWNLATRGYAQREQTIDGRPYLVLMHRMILGLRFGDGRESDHVNRNRLDNRRSNLRVVTRAQNAQNKTGGWGSSRERGVYWDRQVGRWGACVGLNGKSNHIGHFDSEIDAAIAASDFRRKHLPYSNEEGRPAIALAGAPVQDHGRSR